MATLSQLGWNSFFERHRMDIGDDTLAPARVSFVAKNSCRVVNAAGAFQATIAGRVFRDSTGSVDVPAAGDWVMLQASVIRALLPRQNALIRGASGSRGKRADHPRAAQVIAANVDTVFVVCGLDRDYNLRRLERYLTWAFNCGCMPAVILNKCDLHSHVDDFIADVSAVAMGVPVHAVSARAGTGLEQLEPYLTPGRTAVLVGSSGAGKSTLVNRLAGRPLQATRPVSGSDGKGVHTTTARNLILLSTGGMIIDNPGLREIALWEDGEGIARIFPEIGDLAEHCRYADCSHRHEPGCRVREAVDAGALAADRLESYLKMQREMDFIVQRRNKSADRIEKERWKGVAKRIKAMKGR